MKAARRAGASFSGVHAIVYALFDADERLDRAAMRRQVQACLACGVHGMAAPGLATEVSKLSEAERRTVMDWIAEDTADHVPPGLTIFGSSARRAGCRCSTGAAAWS